jgi:hypothetical protein
MNAKRRNAWALTCGLSGTNPAASLRAYSPARSRRICLDDEARLTCGRPQLVTNSGPFAAASALLKVTQGELLALALITNVTDVLPAALALFT